MASIGPAHNINNTSYNIISIVVMVFAKSSTFDSD